MSTSLHRVVIVGGGFAGLNAAQKFKGAPVEVTLIDKRNFHLFQPLLYQVATGALSPANIAAPLRAVLKKQRNCRVLLGDVSGVDLPNKQVLIGEERIGFDSLIVAAGAGNFYFGHPEWEKHAPGLKTIEEATDIRRRVLTAFEAAERFSNPAARARLLTFVIVGGGPTGVEMAGAISELARHTLRQNFRNFDPTSARILLVEGNERVLPPFPEKLSTRATQVLWKMGVEVRTSSHVKDIQADHVLIERNGNVERIDTNTVMWAAGVRASPLGKLIADATGATLDRGGRVVVEPDLSIAGHPNLFVVGDLAAAKFPDGKPLPGVAPVAMQQGKYVANVIIRRLEGNTPAEPFRYWDKGSMATIGRNAAVVDLYWFRFSGWFAWMTWLFVHIMYLVHFQNRLLVLMQWFWNYVTRNRAARLITGEEAVRTLTGSPPNEVSATSDPPHAKTAASC
ncbi:MAG: NAD(P)/FAD-dependent oxidoreductase [Planctomycetes bacterium]|nr:NAD(P)/FAD-dependent oxidoreductase [Planctomycetota bacterium]